jgi:hypothetical protein
MSNLDSQFMAPAKEPRHLIELPVNQAKYSGKLYVEDILKP